MPAIKYHFLQSFIVSALATRGLLSPGHRPPVRATKPQHIQNFTTRLSSRPVLDAEDYLDSPLDRSDDWTDGPPAVDLRVPCHSRARRRSCSQSSGEQPLRLRGHSEAGASEACVQGRRWFNNSGTSPELSPQHLGQGCAPTPPNSPPKASLARFSALRLSHVAGMRIGFGSDGKERTHGG